MKAKRKPCENGCTTFVVRTPMHGVWKSYFELVDGEYEHTESSTDDLKYGDAPKCMFCDVCGKRHPNKTVEGA